MKFELTLMILQAELNEKRWIEMSAMRFDGLPSSFAIVRSPVGIVAEDFLTWQKNILREWGYDLDIVECHATLGDTAKVISQMRQGDLHAFPECVGALQEFGRISKIKGRCARNVENSRELQGEER